MSGEEALDDIETDPIDDAASAADLVDQDAAEGGDKPDPVARVAKKMGWSPKDKWKGDPDKWVDAETFLDKTPGLIKNLQERVDRNNRATREIIERERAKAVKEAESKLKQARESGDIEAALEAQEEFLEAKKPDPDVQSSQMRFKQENPWFQTNDEATAIAIAAAEIAVRQGKGAEEQFELAVKAVRKAMPELFEGDSDLDGSVSKPEPRKVPSMQGGQRMASSVAPRERGWGDIPASARASVEKELISAGMCTKEEYAKSYWKENGR
jgi:hypothetical protein